MASWVSRGHTADTRCAVLCLLQHTSASRAASRHAPGGQRRSDQAIWVNMSHWRSSGPGWRCGTATLLSAITWPSSRAPSRRGLMHSGRDGSAQGPVRPLSRLRRVICLEFAVVMSRSWQNHVGRSGFASNGMSRRCVCYKTWVCTLKKRGVRCAKTGPKTRISTSKQGLASAVATLVRNQCANL